MFKYKNQKGGNEVSNRNFMEMLQTQWFEGKFVCIGLDFDVWKAPTEFIEHSKYMSAAKVAVAFNHIIVEATKDLVCAYKLNIAFYGSLGAEGIWALKRTIKNIHTNAPNVPVILDAKCTDIENANNYYVDMAFSYLEADAITVNPYLGAEALQPFLARSDKGVIVLCKTSNLGAREFQVWDISGDVVPRGYMPLYEYIAYRVSSEWNKNGNCALIVGATYPEQLREVRKIIGSMPILIPELDFQEIPRVGFQQKDVPLERQVEQVVDAAKDGHGAGFIINSSHDIIFSSKSEDFAEISRRKTEELCNLINQYR